MQVEREHRLTELQGFAQALDIRRAELAHRRRANPLRVNEARDEQETSQDQGRSGYHRPFMGRNSGVRQSDAALVVRQHERDHAYHTTLSLFAEQCEKLLMALLLILLGGAVATGILGALSLREILFALIFVLLVRPLAGWIGTIGTGLKQRERWTIAVFGVRGIGSLYYLAFALNQADFARTRALWSMVCLVVLLSILLHGVSARQVMEWLDRRRGRGRPAV